MGGILFPWLSAYPFLLHPETRTFSFPRPRNVPPFFYSPLASFLICMLSSPDYLSPLLSLQLFADERGKEESGEKVTNA